jgi:hypothetical protein
MNIVKRLLNVLLAISIGMVAYGVLIGGFAHIKAATDRNKSCEFATSFEQGAAKLEKTNPAQLTQQQKDLATEVKRRIPILQAQCKESIGLNVLMSGKTFLLVASIMAMLVILLNYILFGKITLWNRFSRSEQTEKPK